jgi:nuclear pore complex protein Nup155
MIREMGARLGYSEGTFSPSLLIPMIEAFAMNNGISGAWLVELFIHVKFAHETIVSVLQSMYYNEAQPFMGRNKRVLAEHTLLVLKDWYRECIRHNKAIFGGDDNAREIDNILSIFIESQSFTPDERDQANALRLQIANYLGSQF